MTPEQFAKLRHDVHYRIAGYNLTPAEAFELIKEISIRVRPNTGPPITTEERLAALEARCYG